MLKLTPAIGHRFNVAFNGEPVMLKDLKLGDETISQIDKMLHSLKPECGGSVAFLTYEKVIEECRVTFFKHSPKGDIPVYVKDFPEELLEYLAQIKVAVLRHIVIGANSS